MHAFLNNRLVIKSKTSLGEASSTASWANNEGSELQTIEIPWVCDRSDKAAPAKAQMLTRNGVAQKIIIHCGCGQSLEINLNEASA